MTDNHNVWYTARSPTGGALRGRETLTVFWNGVAGEDTSFAVEVCAAVCGGWAGVSEQPN